MDNYKNCVICNIEYKRGYTINKIQWNKSRFCSGKCKSVWMSKEFCQERNPTWKGGKTTISCKVCSTEFQVYPYRLKENPRFCSTKCKGLDMVGRCSGENAANWKGGITPETRRLRASEEYKIWRKAVFERDNYTCQKCRIRPAKGVKVILNADHIKKWSDYPELRFEISNGQTLCEECHAEKTRKESKKYWKNQFGAGYVLESLN